MIEVYIPDENVKGWIVTEMTHGAIIGYYLGGIYNKVLLDREDFVVLNEMFFDVEENE